MGIFKKIFNFKKKNKELTLGDSIEFKDLNKLVKKDKQAVIIPIEKDRKGFNFYKIGNFVYAPVPKLDKKYPTYYKVENMKFVSLSDVNNVEKTTYNISIEYKKHENIHFYSYDFCDEETKSGICNKLQDIVKIEVRNKENLYKKQEKFVQNTLEVPMQDLDSKKETQSCMLLKKPKNAKELADILRYKKLLEQNHEKQVLSKSKQSMDNIKDSTIQQKRSPESISKEEIKNLSQEEIDDIFFFE